MTEDSRISEIRAALNAGCDDFDGCWDCVARHRLIRAILDRPAAAAEPEPVDWPAVAEAFADEITELNPPAPPAPRVFFPGDPIPPGTVAVTRSGHPYENLAADEPTSCGLPLVEVAIPDPQEWQAAVDRAHAALGGPALTTDAELRALTPDQLEKCIHRALEAGDVQAVEGYLLLMAPQDPRRAQDLMNTLKVGLNLAKEQQT